MARRDGQGVSNEKNLPWDWGPEKNVIWKVLGGALFSYKVKTRFASVFEAFQTFLSFFQGALFALLLIGMLTRRATAEGGVTGMLVGVATAAALTATGLLYLWTAFWPFVAASLTLVAVSLVTTRRPDEELRGLVCWIR